MRPPCWMRQPMLDEAVPDKAMRTPMQDKAFKFETVKDCDWMKLPMMYESVQDEATKLDESATGDSQSHSDSIDSM